MAMVAVAAVLASGCGGSEGAGGDAGADIDVAVEAAALDGTTDAEIEASVDCSPTQIVSPIVSIVDSRTAKAICNATLVDAPDDGLFPCFGNDGCTSACQYTVVELGASPSLPSA